MAGLDPDSTSRKMEKCCNLDSRPRAASVTKKYNTYCNHCFWLRAGVGPDSTSRLHEKCCNLDSRPCAGNVKVNNARYLFVDCSLFMAGLESGHQRYNWIHCQWWRIVCIHLILRRAWAPAPPQQTNKNEVTWIQDPVREAWQISQRTLKLLLIVSCSKRVEWCLLKRICGIENSCAVWYCAGERSCF